MSLIKWLFWFESISSGKGSEFLTSKKIPFRLKSSESLFDTKAAICLKEVMRAAIFPLNRSFLKSALATPLFGFSQEALIDERNLIKLLVFSHTYITGGQKRDFLHFFNR